MLTPSEIATKIGLDIAELIPQELINAELQRRVVSVIGQDNYDAIVADMGEGDVYEIIGVLISGALAYYVAAEMVTVLQNRPDQRGVFNLRAETANNAMPEGVDATVAYFRQIANANMGEVIRWIDLNMPTRPEPEKTLGDVVKVKRGRKKKNYDL